MNDVRWRQFASLVKWARQNAEILQTTEPLLPRSWQDGKCPRVTNDARMPREPYGYAHWRDGRGMVLLRNPWIEPQTYPVRLAGDPRAVSAAAKLSAVSIYPEARVYGTDLKPGDILNVPLAPTRPLCCLSTRHYRRRCFLRRRSRSAVGSTSRLPRTK